MGPTTQTRFESAAEGLRDASRGLAKELIWSMLSFRPAGASNICLFGTRRGGTTWIMEVIGANRGVRTLDQPLELLTPTLTPRLYKRLPKTDGGQLICSSELDESQLRGVIADILSGSLPANASVRFWRPGFAWRAHRLALKLLDCKPMIDWFDRAYDIDVVFIVRHPVPQSLSCIRNNWGLTAQSFLRSRWFSEVVLGAELEAFAKRVLDDGSMLEKFVLNWTLENVVPLQLLPLRPNWTALSYEQAVVEPRAMVERLAARLDLPEPDRMMAAAAHASVSSHLSSAEARQAMRSGRLSNQLGAWESTISAEDRAGCAEIFQRFGITLYSMDGPLPNWTGYLHSGQTVRTASQTADANSSDSA